MKELNQAQKNLLLGFFENTHTAEKYPGWKGIAENLINYGSCIVAGDSSIWKGGIGNFIKTGPVETVPVSGCILYTFDAEYFMTSEMYKFGIESRLEEIRQEVIKCDEEKKELEKEFSELSNNQWSSKFLMFS